MVKYCCWFEASHPVWLLPQSLRDETLSDVGRNGAGGVGWVQRKTKRYGDGGVIDEGITFREKDVHRGIVLCFGNELPPPSPFY